MKKFIKTILLAFIILLATPVAAKADKSRDCTKIISVSKNIYAIQGRMANIDYDYNTITFIDFEGEIWAIYDTETQKYANDRIYCLLFSDNGTKTLYDDKIIKILNTI